MSSVDQIRHQVVESQLLTAENADLHIARWREETGAAEDAAGGELIEWLVGQLGLDTVESRIMGLLGPDGRVRHDT